MMPKATWHKVYSGWMYWWECEGGQRHTCFWWWSGAPPERHRISDDPVYVY